MKKNFYRKHFGYAYEYSECNCFTSYQILISAKEILYSLVKVNSYGIVVLTLMVIVWYIDIILQHLHFDYFLPYRKLNIWGQRMFINVMTFYNNSISSDDIPRKKMVNLEKQVWQNC